MKLKKHLLMLQISTMILGSHLAMADRSTDEENYIKKENNAKVANQLDAAIKKGIHITEMGNLRIHQVMNVTASNYSDDLQKILSDYNFRLTPDHDQVIEKVFNAAKAEEIMKKGTEKHADIFIVTSVSEKLRNKFGGTFFYKSTAVTKTFHAHTGELISVSKVTKNGKRKIDEDEAKESATLPALKESTKKAIAKAVNKAEKMLLHEVTLAGVESERDALWIANYIKSYKEVYHVRRVSFDHKRSYLTLEIIASPKSEKFWRAWVENMKTPNTKEAVALLKQANQNKPVEGKWIPKKKPKTTYKPNGEWRTDNKDWINE